jgi:hypothetical protein
MSYIWIMEHTIAQAEENAADVQAILATQGIESSPETDPALEEAAKRQRGL